MTLNNSSKLAVAFIGVACGVIVRAQAPAISMSPTSPQILAGQTQQFSATSAFTPTAIAGGGYHTCLMFPDSTLRCAGANSWGQLGNGTFSYGENTPQPVGTNAAWQAVSAGYHHTVAVRTDGTLWAWGWNGYGQLGNGTFTEANTPQPVATNATWRAVELIAAELLKHGVISGRAARHLFEQATRET